MSQNFAPYQDTSPDVERTLSPPPKIKSPSQNPKPQIQHSSSNYSALSPPGSPSYQNSTGIFHPDSGEEAEAQESTYLWGRRNGVDLYETSLGIRLDWEACLAYLALPPVGAIFLLMFEHRSDYVRFHAWQSTLLFASILVVHLVFSWSPHLSWIFFIADLVLIVLLTLRAYKDGEFDIAKLSDWSNVE
jgi:uncharacterized membrane protein